MDRSNFCCPIRDAHSLNNLTRFRMNRTSHDLVTGRQGFRQSAGMNIDLSDDPTSAKIVSRGAGPSAKAMK